MTKLKFAKVYRIYSVSNPEKVYIGSTCEPTLARRLAGHKGGLNRYNKNWWNGYNSSYDVLCYSDAKIELIQAYPDCKSRDELRKYEGEHIRKTQCVNRNIPGRTPKEWREKQKKEMAERFKDIDEEERKENELKEKQKAIEETKKKIEELYSEDMKGFISNKEIKEEFKDIPNILKIMRSMGYTTVKRTERGFRLKKNV